MPANTLPNILNDKNAPVHIIGGGGVGMSALALLLKSMGHRVSASDQNDSFYLKQLQEANIPTWEGSKPQNLTNCAVVFHSTAVKADDPEIIYAKENHIKVFSRHALLQYVTRHFYVVAVCGTHGKTTTSAWLTHLFKSNGKDVNALVGGKMLNWGSNFLQGDYCLDQKPVLIMEADESDNSFLSIDADVICLTNIEMDHPDHFHSIEDIYQSFRHFIENCLSKNGRVFFSISFEEALLEKIIPQTAKNLLGDHRQNIAPIKIDFESSTLSLNHQVVPVNLSGNHNLFNASLVLQLALEFQFSYDEIARACSTFEGVARRMQKLGDINNRLLIIDDYAHHPTEVKAVLQSLSLLYRDFEIHYFFEIHRLSRFCYFGEDFFKAFSQIAVKNSIKNLTLLEPFTAGENIKDFPQTLEYLKKFQNAQAKVLAKNYSDEEWLSTIDKICQQTDKNTVLMFLGAGNSSKIAHHVLELLKNRVG